MMVITPEIHAFVAESNRIEGIRRPPTGAELAATIKFLALPRVEVDDLCGLVGVFAPGHRLRDIHGLNVRVGKHIAPPGGPEIRDHLELILRGRLDPYRQHVAYETLHPFSDGNGRSGRALWLWSVGGRAPLGFLHSWYYSSLEHGR